MDVWTILWETTAWAHVLLQSECPQLFWMKNGARHKGGKQRSKLGGPKLCVRSTQPLLSPLGPGGSSPPILPPATQTLTWMIAVTKSIQGLQWTGHNTWSDSKREGNADASTSGDGRGPRLPLHEAEQQARARALSILLKTCWGTRDRSPLWASVS